MSDSNIFAHGKVKSYLRYAYFKDTDFVNLHNFLQEKRIHSNNNNYNNNKTYSTFDFLRSSTGLSQVSHPSHPNEQLVEENEQGNVDEAANC